MSPPLTSSSVSAFENNVVACFFSLLRDKFQDITEVKQQQLALEMLQMMVYAGQSLNEKMAAQGCDIMRNRDVKEPWD